MAAEVRRPVDRWLVFFALALLALGMVAIYSASAIKASRTTRPPRRFWCASW